VQKALCRFSGLGAAMLAAAGALAACVQAPEASGPAPAAPSPVPLYIVTYAEFIPSAQASAAALLKKICGADRKAAGNLGCVAAEEIGRPNRFVLLKIWRDQAAADGAAAQTAPLEVELDALRAAPADRRINGGMAVGPARGAIGPGALYAVTHVDVTPPRKDDGAAALAQWRADNIKDAGAIRLDVLQQANRPNHFTLVEAWKNRAAFEAYIAAPHTANFRAAIGPMQGALYDERLYRAID
jgi:quinol monooxygenase YgiN